MAIRKRAKRIRFVNKILHTQRTLRLSNAILLRNINLTIYGYKTSGADPGFQVRGGALKKIGPSEGRRENFWGISCEKSRFYAKKLYFFQF